MPHGHATVMVVSVSPVKTGHSAIAGEGSGYRREA